MEAPEINLIRREVGELMQGLLVLLTQQDGRPITAPILRALREFGLRCYLRGAASTTRATVPAPPESDSPR